MTDLRTLLTEAADRAQPAAAAAPAACVDADLARGRRGLRRHRLARTAPAAALAVLAASVLAVGLTPGAAPHEQRLATAPGATAPGATAPGASEPEASAPGATPSGAVVPAPATRLVAFTGQQPAGYTLDKVPEGWVVSDSNTFALVLAPQGVPDPAPGLFEGKIAVTLQGDATDLKGTVLKVDGRRGVLIALQGGGSTLYVQQPDGAQLAIQVWQGLGWDAQQIIEFAAGVHVTSAAKPVFG